MGRDIPTSEDVPDGGYVTDDDFNKFLHIVDTIVDGYTVQDAQGVWLGEHEDTKIMTICTTKDKAIEVARLYKQAFDQQAVAIVVLPDMEFI